MIDKGVPKEVVEDLKNHFKLKSIEGEEGWQHANEEEDTLTGDFLGQLRSGPQQCGNWSWLVKYRKFRGRGKGAYENIVGADGIITIEIENNGIRENKSIIFQAKKKGNYETSDQLAKMEETLPNANMVIIFSSEGYYGETGSSYSNRKKMRNRVGDYLADVFVSCKHGSWGVDYDANRKELRISDKKVAFVSFGHRLLIKIKKNH